MRVKGGAYGCTCAFSRTGNAFFTSYRDPNLEKTLEAYREAVSFIENYDADERGMTKSIIGAISSLDMPLSPSAEGSRSMGIYLSGDTYEFLMQIGAKWK